MVSKRLAIPFGALAAITLYVHSTMNALHDSYHPGIQAFKLPFQVAGTVAFLVVLAGSVALILSRSFHQRFSSSLASIGVGAVAGALLVLLLGQAPCLRPHPTTDPHYTHHYLSAVVERSLMCPRYSIRSYPLLVAWLVAGGVLIGAARPKMVTPNKRL